MNFWGWMIGLTLAVHAPWWMLTGRPMPWPAALGFGVIFGVGLGMAGIYA